MANMSNRTKVALKILRLIMMGLFTAGFIYQTLQFLFLYWTYPTVVDIQQSSPTYVEVPTFTFCNRVGYRYENMCGGFKHNPCATSVFAPVSAPIICEAYPQLCDNNTLPKKFEIIFYVKFMEKYSIKQEDFPKLAVPLQDYLECTIEYAGKTSECNMENVLGSYYSLDDMPQFCYSIYSKWGNPDKKRDLIPKGATMKFNLFLNMSRRAKLPDGTWPKPLYNPPCDASVQVAVHSPYFLPSPYLAGSSFLGGRAYELRIKLSESHLLPYPYQTNCTDYMTEWKARNGKAPINQLNTIQECRINETYTALGCIPVTMDYPHEHDLCQSCPTQGKPCKFVEPQNNCSILADSFNQPCDSMTYLVDKEDRAITILKRVQSIFAGPSDGIRQVLPMHDCEGDKIWEPQCSTITIDVPFDQFEITNITYNAKFESLELFSVVGGYMGMWLGISLLTVYDVIFDCIIFIRSYCIKKRKKQMKATRVRMMNKNRPTFPRDNEFSTNYQVW